MKHDACIVSTGGLSAEADFEISECKARCSNDVFCKGYSIETGEGPDPITTLTTRIDICYLYTTANATAFCTFGQPKDPNFPTNPPTSMDQIDENAKCNDLRVVPPGVTLDFHEGCHIKIIGIDIS